ncbi:Mak10 subunit, NatC N-terminal acetyltransferase-domain-containing protein [Chytriomyces sp. MP71]|nr:Mak10 subunit, NatC N-terminal acetyltransferase-domain-containing protein [Chytriomyces sp. MP71]
MSRIVLQQEEWVDITPLVSAASEQMGLSQMVRVPTFGLWEAMAALEIMEPRMDNGMAAVHPPSTEKWTVRKAKTIARFSADEIIGVSDMILVKLLSWISGSHLSQTLFSCVLLHEPHACQSHILRPILIGYLKVARRLKGLVELARVAEDDEFFGFLPPGLSLADEVHDNEAVDGLQGVEDALGLELKEARSRMDGNVSAESDATANTLKLEYPESCTQDLERLQFLDAILCRVRFIRSFLSALSYITRRNMGSAKKSLNQSINQLDLCVNSAYLAKDMSIAFDTTVNKKLLSDSPPRAIAEPSTPAAAYSDIRLTLTHILEIVSLPSSGLAWDDTLSFISHFSLRVPQPGVLARSVLVFNCTHAGKLHGKTSYAAALTHSVVSAYPPSAALFASADARVRECVAEFVGLVAGNTGDAGAVEGGAVLERIIVVCGGFNRSLARRNFGKIARELEAIQGGTELIDGALHEHLAKGSLFTSPKPLEEPFYLSSWVYELKLTFLEIYIHMGFELNLYSEFEYHSILWYLDHVYEMHIGHLNRMNTLVARSFPSILELLWQYQQQTDLAREISSSSAGKKKGATSKPISLEAFVAKTVGGVSVRDLNEAVLVARQLIGRAQMLFTFALRRDGYLANPKLDFYSEEVVYNHRFKLFMNMGSPSTQPYTEFKASEAVFLEMSAREMVERGSRFFAEARELLSFLAPFKAKLCASSVTLKDEMEVGGILSLTVCL